MKNNKFSNDILLGSCAGCNVWAMGPITSGKDCVTSRVSIYDYKMRMGTQTRYKFENQPFINLRTSYSFYSKIENEPPRRFIKLRMSLQDAL